MIQLNELRLGNWVCDSKFSQFPMQVVNLGTDYVYLDFDGNEGDVWEPDIKEMCGISLTKELILKCGFVKVGMAYKKDVFIVNSWSDGRLWLGGGYGHSLELKSLHQFQNIYFALTGEELNIEL